MRNAGPFLAVKWAAFGGCKDYFSEIPTCYAVTVIHRTSVIEYRSQSDTGSTAFLCDVGGIKRGWASGNRPLTNSRTAGPERVKGGMLLARELALERAATKRALVKQIGRRNGPG